MSVNKTNKIKIALAGPGSAPKLLAALQLGYSLCRNWNRIIVLGSSLRDGMYRHLGEYTTLRIEKDNPSTRYTELLNIAAGCGKDVVIFSSLSDEWLSGTSQHLQSSFYEDVLRAHRTFLICLRNAPVHVIGLIETRTTYLQKDSAGKRKLRTEEMVQQQDIGQFFTTVLRQDKRGNTTVEKDELEAFPTNTPFRINFETGALLHDWVKTTGSKVSQDMQKRIDSCNSLQDLHRLLFEIELDDLDTLSALTRRRLELEVMDTEQMAIPTLKGIPGGLL